MNAHRLPWRVDNPGGALATIGLAAVLHHAGSPARVWSDNGQAVCDPIDGLAELVGTTVDQLVGPLAQLTKPQCPSRCASHAAWYTHADDPWWRAICYPDHENKEPDRVVLTPFAGGLRIAPTTSVAGHAAACINHVNGRWDLVLGDGLTISRQVSGAANKSKAAGFAVGWSDLAMPRIATEPLALSWPGQDLLCLAALRDLPILPGMLPAGWIVDPRRVRAWCWPEWNQPLALPAILDLVHGPWEWQLKDGVVTAARRPAPPVTHLWASVQDKRSSAGNLVEVLLPAVEVHPA